MGASSQQWALWLSLQGRVLLVTGDSNGPPGRWGIELVSALWFALGLSSKSLQESLYHSLRQQPPSQGMSMSGETEHPESSAYAISLRRCRLEGSVHPKNDDVCGWCRRGPQHREPRDHAPSSPSKIMKHSSTVCSQKTLVPSDLLSHHEISGQVATKEILCTGLSRGHLDL